MLAVVDCMSAQEVGRRGNTAWRRCGALAPRSSCRHLLAAGSASACSWQALKQSTELCSGCSTTDLAPAMAMPAAERPTVALFDACLAAKGRHPALEIEIAPVKSCKDLLAG